MISVVGLDFDNTIANYDRSFHELVKERALLSDPVPSGKDAVREKLRALPNGELFWQEIQAFAYGPEINRAELNEGVLEFLEGCNRMNIQVRIISHKTKYARRDRNNCDLRKAAIGWLADKKLLDGKLISIDDIYFESTREQKVDRIISTGCNVFVDDLPETFLEANFPERVIKVLFNPSMEADNIMVDQTVNSFSEVGDYIFKL